MQFDSVIVRYDEIGLKSRFVKKDFCKILARNIRRAVGNYNIRIKESRLLIKSDEQDLTHKISRVFGVSSASMALEVEQDINKIKEAALSLYTGGVFRISCQRISKEFKLNSVEVCEEVGSYVVDKTNAKVDLKNYDVNIGIEFFNNKAYIFNDKIRGFGGLPVGSQGKVLAVVNDNRGFLAALLIMNRGCFPIIMGDRKYLAKLREFAPGFKLGFMTDEVKALKNCLAVVLGSDLDEPVLSLNKNKYKVPVLYPLIGLSEDFVSKRFFEK